MINILKKIPIICFLFAITLNCNAQNNNSYKQALNYISNDDELVKMLRDHNLYYPTLLYSNSELVYKVYPEKPGTLFSLFRRELELMNKDYNDFMNLETTIDSTLTVYTKSDTARVKIFFSNKVDNLIASEVFFRKELFNNESFDDYRGNSMFNTAMKYLFVFEEGQIDTVFKMVQQYE